MICYFLIITDTQQVPGEFAKIQGASYQQEWYKVIKGS